MEKLLAFTSKVGGEITIPARKGKETTVLKVTVKKTPKVVSKSQNAAAVALHNYFKTTQNPSQIIPNISLLKSFRELPTNIKKERKTSLREK